MRIPLPPAFFVVVLSSAIACSNNSTQITSPSSLPDTGHGAMATVAPSSVPSILTAGARTLRQVTMMDACSPSFNLFVGPGTCTRNGGVDFNEFVAQLTAHQAAGAWHNAPDQTDAWLGDSLVAVNNGGEVHTFTRVTTFGGGIVPFLNDLSGNETIVPECVAESTFVPPGGTDTETLDQTDQLKFQCCIHPWMRTTVLVKSH